MLQLLERKQLVNVIIGIEYFIEQANDLVPRVTNAKNTTLITRQDSHARRTRAPVP